MGNHSESLPAGTGSNSPAGLKARTIKLPIPPSVNAAYVNRKTGKGVGRYKTKRYKSWERQADWWCASAGSTHLSVTACKDPGLGRVQWCEIDISEAA